MTDTLILVAAATTLVITRVCAADSITVDGKTYSDVYIVNGPSMYYVCFPTDGTIMNVAKSKVKEADVLITEQRLTLKEQFERKRNPISTTTEPSEAERRLELKRLENESAQQVQAVEHRRAEREQQEQDVQRKKAKDEWLHTQPAHTVASLRSEILDYLSQSKDCGQLVSATVSNQIDGKQRHEVVTTTGTYSFVWHRGKIVETNFTPLLRPPTEEVPIATTPPLDAMSRKKLDDAIKKMQDELEADRAKIQDKYEADKAQELKRMQDHEADRAEDLKRIQRDFEAEQRHLAVEHELRVKEIQINSEYELEKIRSEHFRRFGW